MKEFTYDEFVREKDSKSSPSPDDDDLTLEQLSLHEQVKPKKVLFLKKRNAAADDSMKEWASLHEQLVGHAPKQRRDRRAVGSSSGNRRADSSFETPQKGRGKTARGRVSNDWRQDRRDQPRTPERTPNHDRQQDRLARPGDRTPNRTPKSTPRDKRNVYALHFDQDVIDAGLVDKTLFKGVLRINKKNRQDAYVKFEDRDDVFIPGIKNQNRALEGDTVVIRLLKDKELERGTIL